MTIDPKHATRSTSKSSYIDTLAASSPSGPVIYLRSQASKILFDGRNKATGVAATTDGENYVLSAKKEVILSAGVFHSPQLLMLSGKLLGIDFPTTKTQVQLTTEQALDPRTS